MTDQTVCTSATVTAPVRRRTGSLWRAGRRTHRSQRGLSQTTETAILVAAAVGMAVMITSAVWPMVENAVAQAQSAAAQQYGGRR